MTDFSDDELVSAVLDGEATEDEVARVHADAALSARIGELRAAREAIAAPVTLPSAVHRDAAIAAALAASAPATVRPVDDLHDRRRRRSLRIASIAAAVLVVVGVVGAIAALSGRESRKATSAAGGQASVSSAAPLPEGAAGSVAPNSAGASPPLAAASELGSFQTPQDLVDAVRRSPQTAAASASGAASQRDNAAAPDALATSGSCLTRPDATFVARAELSGEPVVVIVSGNPGQQTVEVDDLNCAVVFTSPL